ncbi:MAG: hypothetical protein DRN06_02965 [Thermoprotei archaeon]|nr:MAG: hypothetical protein DRN06_02965 [Thermoprotei archaeon]
MNITVEIKVDPKAIEKLMRMAKLEGVSKAIREGTDELWETARANAPVRTGALRGSITKRAAGLKGVVTPTIYYAVFVELGHRIVAWGHDTGRWWPGVFYLKRAVDSKADSIVRKIIKEWTR